MEQIKFAYGYIRVSTKQQAGEDRNGPEAQKQAISEFADKNGYTIVKWFTDEISGVKEDRPKLNEILYTDLPKKDCIEAVIAYKSDRIARDIKLYFYYLSLLEKKSIRLLSVNEQFDNVPDGVASLVRAIMMFVAEQERSNIAMRTRSGRKVKSSMGGYSGGKPPYGYMVREHGLVINEKEARIVRRIFAWREEGYTLQHIVNTLNNDGIRTRKGGWFAPSLVQSILGNVNTYMGMYKYGKDGKWTDGQHEPILHRWPVIDKKLRGSGRKHISNGKYVMEQDIEPEIMVKTKENDTDEPKNDVVEQPQTNCPDLNKPVLTHEPRKTTFIGGVFSA